MTLPKFALNYEACTPEELLQFCRSRGLQPVATIESVQLDAGTTGIVDTSARESSAFTASDRLDATPSGDSHTETPSQLDAISSATPHVEAPDSAHSVAADQLQTIDPEAHHAMTARERPTTAILVDSLSIADANIRFRFLDLPKELRNHIYEYLLALHKTTVSILDDSGKVVYSYVDPSEHVCHPRILATCKFINQEASSFLYEKHTLGLDCFHANDADWFQSKHDLNIYSI